MILTPRALFDGLQQQQLPGGFVVSCDLADLDSRPEELLAFMFREENWSGLDLPKGDGLAADAIISVRFHQSVEEADADFDGSRGVSETEEARAHCDRYAVIPASTPARMGSPVLRVGRVVARFTCLNNHEAGFRVAEAMARVLRQA